MSRPPLRVALIHEFLVHMRGAERLLRALASTFPSADIHLLVSDPSLVRQEFAGRRVAHSFVNTLPRARKNFRALLPLYPYAVERFDLSDYDLVLSNSMGFSHGVLTQPSTCHISCVSNPFRYAWNWYHGYLAQQRGPRSVLIQLVLHQMRKWDRLASERVDHFIAVSNITQQRVRKFYGRQSFVLHPPIEVAEFHQAEAAEDFYLIVSALMPYKRIDIAVEAFSRLGLPLKIIGTGPELHRLTTMAGPNVEFLGWGSDAVVREAYARCRAFIMTANEDFGLTPLEAQASGRPVIAYGVGGVLETVRNGVDGVFFGSQTADALAEVVSTFDHRQFEPSALRAHATEFDVSAYRPALLAFVHERLALYRESYGLPSLGEAALVPEVL